MNFLKEDLCVECFMWIFITSIFYFIGGVSISKFIDDFCKKIHVCEVCLDGEKCSNKDKYGKKKC